MTLEGGDNMKDINFEKFENELKEKYSHVEDDIQRSLLQSFAIVATEAVRQYHETISTSSGSEE